MRLYETKWGDVRGGGGLNKCSGLVRINASGNIMHVMQCIPVKDVAKDLQRVKHEDESPHGCARHFVTPLSNRTICNEEK